MLFRHRWSGSGCEDAGREGNARKAREVAFARARAKAFEDAKGFVHRKPPTKAARDAAQKAGRKPPRAAITRTPYEQAYTVLYEKYAPGLLGRGAPDKKLKARLGRLIQDALATVAIRPKPFPTPPPQSPYHRPGTKGTVR